MTTIIPHVPTERTKYSNEHGLKRIRTEDPTDLYQYLLWLFWDTSTEFMVSHGLPTAADVDAWIVALEERTDADAHVIQQCIMQCKEYNR